MSNNPLPLASGEAFQPGCCKLAGRVANIAGCVAATAFVCVQVVLMCVAATQIGYESPSAAAEQNGSETIIAEGVS